MKLEVKRSEPVYVLTLSMDEAEALYYSISLEELRTHEKVINQDVEAAVELANDIETELGKVVEGD